MASEFGRRAYNYYLGRGYRPAQAAALAGNAMAESGGSTSVIGDQGKALGLFQWHPDRQARLFDYAKSQGLDPKSEQAQLGFFDWELSNTERKAGEMLRAAQTPEQAQAAVLASLRPKGFSMNDPTQSHNYAGRLKNVMSLLGTEGGGVTPMDPSALSAQTTPTTAMYSPDPLTSLQRIGNAIAPSMVSAPTPMTPDQMMTGGLLGKQNSLLGGDLGNMGLALMQQQERMQRAMPVDEEDLGPGIQQGQFAPIRFSRGLL